MYRVQNNEHVAKNRNITPKPAKMQNDFRANREVVEDKKKAITLVKVVIVMEGPACLKPSTNLSSTDRLESV